MWSGRKPSSAQGKVCEKLFATAEGLKAHMSTHKKLSKKKDSCPHCQKAGFTREKSLKDHIRFCESNPNKVGPFPCPVADCHRGPANPFNRTRESQSTHEEGAWLGPKTSLLDDVSTEFGHYHLTN